MSITRKLGQDIRKAYVLTGNHAIGPGIVAKTSRFGAYGGMVGQPETLIRSRDRRIRRTGQFVGGIQLNGAFLNVDAGALFIHAHHEPSAECSVADRQDPFDGAPQPTHLGSNENGSHFRAMNDLIQRAAKNPPGSGAPTVAGSCIHTALQRRNSCTPGPRIPEPVEPAARMRPACNRPGRHLARSHTHKSELAKTSVLRKPWNSPLVTG